MDENSSVVRLRLPDEIDDPLTNILRNGARRLLTQAVEMEAEAFLATMRDFKLPDGRDRVVRHGHGPERTIQTGIGPVEVSSVKIRDRGAAINGERIRFSSAILPKWARRTKSLDALLPVLYLRGISTGDFQEALAALLGKEAPNLSAAVISRLTAEGKDEYDRWQKSAQSWRELLVEVKRRGLKIAPEIAVGDGGLGFWKAIDEVLPGTRHQRCWVHKTANVLNKVALSVQANMKKDLREVYLAPNRASAEVAIDVFAEKYGAKYDKAVECLTKDRETLLAFYAFPRRALGSLEDDQSHRKRVCNGSP